MEAKVGADPVKTIVDPDNPMHIETPLMFAPLMSSRLDYDVYLKLDVFNYSICSAFNEH